MSFRAVTYDFSEDPTFATKSQLTLTYGATPQYLVDGSIIAPQSDLSSLVEVLTQFEDDIADGSADPTEIQLRTAGGTDVTRAVVANTLTLGPRPPAPFARLMALRDLLVFLGY